MLKELKALASALQKINIHSPKLTSLISLAQNLDLDEEDAEEKIESQKDVKIEPGDKVRIIEGKYGGMTATVIAINEFNEMAELSISMFGRPVTAIEFLSGLELISKSPLDKMEYNKEIVSPQEFKNILRSLAEKNPQYFLKNFGLKLETLDDEGVQLFEKALLKVTTGFKNSSTSYDLLPLLIPIFLKYPEYFNLKVIDPKWFLNYFLNNYRGSKENPLLFKLISDNMLVEAFRSLESEQDKTFIASGAISNIPYRDEYFEKIISHYPDFMELIYDYIIENIPSYYFIYNLGNYFKNNYFTRSIDKKNTYGNISPPQVDEDYIIYKLFLIDPKQFLELGLDQTHPTLKYEEEMSFVEKEKLSEEGVYLGDPTKNTTIRAIDRILANPSYYDLNFLIEKNYAEKYPQLIDKIKYKLLSDRELLINYIGIHSYRYKANKKDISEINKDLFEEIAENLIYNQRYEEFFDSKLHIIFSDLANKLARKIYSSDPSLFYELGLLNLGFAKAMYKVGDKVEVHAGGKFNPGIIVDYVEGTGDMKVQYDYYGKRLYIELNASSGDVQKDPDD